MTTLATPAEESARFKALQAQLTTHFRRFQTDPKRPYTAVVVPSQSVDPRELARIEGVAHYEERALFNLMLLRHPRLKVIFVTSKRLDPLIVDYYLHQMRSVPTAHARRRLLLLDCDDASLRPLSAKLLERPHLLNRIRASIDDLDMAHLAVFNATDLERRLSLTLGIPLNACDPDLTPLGSKTGSREVFAAAGLPLLPGHGGLRDTNDLAVAVADLSREHPSARRFVVKLNDSFSGEGNALLNLPGGALSATQAAALLPSLRFEASGLTWPEYEAQYNAMGGICELWLEGSHKRSPSVQLRINPAHQVQAISTHDQELGGPSGQIFLGATFPAAPEYRLDIQKMGLEVGQILAERGVIGRFGVDFIVAPGQETQIYPLEINLRQGGTTHPFNTLKFITDGEYDRDTGEFLTAQHQPRAYFATDNLSSPLYRGILPFDLLDRLVLEGIHFRADETGVVFHLMGCLSQYGKLGCTAIARSIPEARALYQQTVEMLDDLSRAG